MTGINDHIHRGKLHVEANTYGAELQSIRYDGVEYLWQGDPRWWDRRAPVLFPIVGVLRNDTAMTVNGPAPLRLHGFAWLREFEVVDRDETMILYELDSDESTIAEFPFDFRFQVKYTLLDDDTLEQRFYVINDWDAELPFFVGGHPGFNVPLDPDGEETFEDYVIKFAKPWTYSSPSLTPEHLTDFDHPFPVVKDSDELPLTHELFTKVDTITFENVPDQTLTLLGKKSGHGVTVNFPNFPYAGSWSAANDGPFVCLEPWTGMSTCTDEDNDFAHKRGVIILGPGEVWDEAFTIKVF